MQLRLTLQIVWFDLTIDLFSTKRWWSHLETVHVRWDCVVESSGEMENQRDRLSHLNSFTYCTICLNSATSQWSPMNVDEYGTEINEHRSDADFSLSSSSTTTTNRHTFRTWSYYTLCDTSHERTRSSYQQQMIWKNESKKSTKMIYRKRSTCWNHFSLRVFFLIIYCFKNFPHGSVWILFKGHHSIRWKLWQVQRRMQKLTRCTSATQWAKVTRKKDMLSRVGILSLVWVNRFLKESSHIIVRRKENFHSNQILKNSFSATWSTISEITQLNRMEQE